MGISYAIMQDAFLPSVDKDKHAFLRPKWALSAFSSLAGGSPPASCGLASPPFFLAGKSSGVFRERKPRTARQTRQPGFSPGNEHNKAGRDFSPEKPCLLLSTDGINTGTICETSSHRERLFRQAPPPALFKVPGRDSTGKTQAVEERILLLSRCAGLLIQGTKPARTGTSWLYSTSRRRSTRLLREMLR